MAKKRGKKRRPHQNQAPTRQNNVPRNQYRDQPTIADALSGAMKLGLEKLRFQLVEKAKAAVKTALSQPLPQWKYRHQGERIRPQYLKKLTKPPVRVIRTRQATSKKKMVIKNKVSPPKKDAPFEFWELPLEAEVRESPPPSVSKQMRATFDQILEDGKSVFLNETGEVLLATIGLDFGTSSTKVIVRLPYEPGSPTIAIPAPAHCRSDGHPYLWQTVLWVTEKGQFLSYPLEGSKRIHGLKQRIMQEKNPGSIFPDIPNLKEVERSHAAVAYLTFVIRYVAGWIAGKSEHLIRGKKVHWFVNLGMAAANYDNEKLLRQYRRIGAAAVQMARAREDITVNASAEYLSNADVEKAADDPELAERLGVAIIPETAAEATGFAKSTDSAPGLYLMVNIGAMTLDVCMFRLQTDAQGVNRYPIYMADVRPLGVEAYYWYRKDGKSEMDFLEQCQYCLRNVVWKTRTHRDKKAKCWSAGHQLVTFVTGGGALNSLHQDVISSLGPMLQEHTDNSGIHQIPIKIPETIHAPEALKDFGRLSVAWGLSYPPTEIGEIIPSSEIKDIPPAKILDNSDLYISKDQV
jgi:hypothetical protein